MTRSALVLALSLSLAACGGDEAGGGADPATKTPSFMMDADIPSAGSVFAAKKKAPAEEVVVLGRVRDITDGFAAFTMIDKVMEYCGQGSKTDDHCATPWDYCCDQAEVVNEASLPVEFRDEKGQPVEATDLGLRLLDLVVVKGKLEKTESGGLLLVTTSGWFRRERPELGKHVQWP